MAQSKASSIGWMFVPQYYTFVNKDPERLHCFYTKRSTLIHGVEGEECTPCYGQQEIHEKIMSIGFDDCKVFVSNVDSQGSAENGIVVQVLGELSNKGGPWRKFAQTFFLAEQPNGYFVLNDIFRYIKEESDEETQDVIEPSSSAAAPAVSAQEQQPGDATGDAVAAAAPQDVNLSDVHGPASTAAAVTVSHAAEPTSEHTSLENTVNGTEQQVVEMHDEIGQDPAPVEAPAAETGPETTQVNGTHEPEEQTSAAAPESASSAPAAEEESPASAEPAPTPAASERAEQPTASTSAPTPAAQPSAPPKPSGPPVPKTWANLAAAGSNKWKTQVMSSTQGVSSAATSNAPSGASTPASTSAAGAGGSTSASGSGSGFQGSSNYPTGPGHETGFSVIVRGITQEMSHNSLRRRFSDEFGVREAGQSRKELAKIPYIHIDRPEGIAYMDFETEKGMERAIKKGSCELDGTSLKIEDGRGVARPQETGRQGAFGSGRGRGDGKQRGASGRGGPQGAVGRGGREGGASSAARGRGGKAAGGARQ